MAHIASIGASLFSDLSISTVTVTSGVGLTPAELAALNVAADYFAYFKVEPTPPAYAIAATGNFVRIKNVREFPSMGTPPNIVNVPGYGSKTSQQVQGQSDAPSLEITVNYVAEDWKSGSVLGDMVGDQVTRLFRFTLLNAEPTGTDTAKYASTAPGVGTRQNSQYFWTGKVEALQVNPQLTDATTATITFTIQSDFNGAFTI
jgi:hypothetical protein